MAGLVFEWDENKARHNLRKHGVGFVASLAVFEDPRRIERVDDRREEYRLSQFPVPCDRFSRVLGRRRCAGDAVSSSSAVDAPRAREKRPCGRPSEAPGGVARRL
jgi:hypothetical protein